MERNSAYRILIARSMGRVALAMWNLPINGRDEDEIQLAVEATEHLAEAYECLHTILEEE